MEVATAPTPDANAAVIAALAGNNLGALRNVAAPAKEEAPAPPAPAAPATATPAAPVAAAQTTPVDPFIQALSGQEPTTPVWDDGAKTLFKQTYGEEDPIAYKQKVSQVMAEVDILKKDVEQGRNITAALTKIEKENPAFHAAIIEQLEGRDGLAYIAQLPNANILGKSAQELKDETLFRTYMGDKFTEDEWKAYKSGDYDEVNLTKEVMEAKISALRPVAEMLHDQRNQEYLKGIQAREQQITQAREQDTQVRAAAIAAATSDPYAKLYVNQENIEAFRNGSLFNGVFTQENGALHPNAFAAAIKAQHYDSDVKRAYEAGLNAGKQSGLQEGTAQLPNARPGGRVVTAQEERKGDPNAATLSAALRAS